MMMIGNQFTPLHNNIGTKVKWTAATIKPVVGYVKRK